MVQLSAPARATTSVDHSSHFNPRKISRRARLVLLTRDLRIGGAERQLAVLAKNIDRTLFDVVVVCLYDEGTFAKEVRASGVPVITLGKRGRWDIPFLWRFVRLLRRLRPDIVHSYLPIQNLLAVFVKPAVPATRVVWGVRDSNMEPISDWFARVVARLQTLFSGLPDLTIFNSHAGQEQLVARGFAGSRTVVIPNGVDISRFVPDRASGLRLRALWQVPEEAILIGIVSRLDPMKDHPTFLRAAAKFVQVRPDAKFVCVGAGPEQYFCQLRTETDRLGLAGKVTWTGFLDDMSSVYNALDFCCSSSCYGEGTSNSIAEAMACGVPCVVTEVGDSRLIVGDTGIVVPPRDPEALAAAWTVMVRRLADDLHLREAARARIKSRFSVSALLLNTSEALRSVL